ncbi:major capsid protein [Microvirus D_HF4_340]|nr:major capsid protein [Microvirus D_HF4_340]
MKQQSVGTHNFAYNPKAPIPRSSYPVRQGYKTTFSASYLIPCYLEETSPGDIFNIRCTAVCRTAVPIAPIVDNWRMDFFYFYLPHRVSWVNWEKFMGSQDNPGDSISYVTPKVSSPTGGWPAGSIGDYFGLGTVGQITAGVNQQVCAFALRMYNRVWNEWFRHEDLQNSLQEYTDNGPDAVGFYNLATRNKRFDYITQALPFVQKGTAVTIPLGTTAPIVSTGVSIAFDNPAATRTGTTMLLTSGVNTPTWSNTTVAATGGATFGAAGTTLTSLQVNLAAASAAQVNVMRTAVATQQLLERDARGGTRYPEGIFSHWNVRVADYRVQRPEYLGGGSVPVMFDAIPQTGATGATGTTTPQGNLAATGSAHGTNGFSYAATEHGYIMGLCCVTADLNYSQGLRKHWTRNTRYDYPFPEFAHLGEQPLLNKELYAVGSATGGVDPADQDMQTFGYVPRYDEQRHFPSQITGMFRPRTTGNIAFWHSAENFAALPTLASAFMTDNTRTVIERNFAGGAATQNQQFLCDFLYTGRVTRNGLPTYAIPGLTRF